MAATLGSKITLVFTTLMVFLVVFLATQWMTIRAGEIERSALLELKTTGSLVQSSIGSFLQIDREDLIDGLISEVRSDPRMRFVGVSQTDCTLRYTYRAQRTGSCLFEHVDGVSAEELQQVAASGVSQYKRVESGYVIGLLPIAAIDLNVLNRDRYVLVLMQSYDASAVSISQALNELLMLMGAVLSVVVVAWLFLNAQITRRINRVASAVRFLRKGGVLERIEVAGADEIGLLARGLEAFSQERLAAEARLRDAEKIFNSTIQGIMLTDPSGNIRDVNQAFENITGYRRDEVIGQPASMLKSGHHGDEFYRDMWHSIAERGSWSGEITNLRKSGDEFPELLSINAIPDEQGAVSGYAAIFSDISEIKHTEQQIDFLTHHDPLTGLANKTLFESQLVQAVRTAKRRGLKLAVAYIDIDRFKMLNDSRGMALGDEILRQFARRISDALDESNLLSRFSADEFVLLIENISTPSDALRVVDTLIDALRKPFLVGEEALHVTVSIGISLYPSDTQDAQTLIRHADSAMARAKANGRNTFMFYTPDLTDMAVEHFSIHNALIDALETDEFYLVYQPQRSLKTGKYVGMEALLRWEHPELGLVSPARFIPIAESTGMIKDIGLWVLRTACRQAKAWSDAGHQFGRVSVNVSGPQFMQPNFIALLEQVIDETGIDPQHLELEVTESFLMHDVDDATRKLEAARRLGITVALDDFGTGYSSLSYLRRLPVDKIKIDQSFIRELSTNTGDQAIVRSVIALSHALELLVIAEGVETEEQASFLRALGCHEAQGYLISRPVKPAGLWFIQQDKE